MLEFLVFIWNSYSLTCDIPFLVASYHNMEMSNSNLHQVFNSYPAMDVYIYVQFIVKDSSAVVSTLVADTPHQGSILGNYPRDLVK